MIRVFVLVLIIQCFLPIDSFSLTASKASKNLIHSSKIMNWQHYLPRQKNRLYLKKANENQDINESNSDNENESTTEEKEKEGLVILGQPINDFQDFITIGLSAIILFNVGDTIYYFIKKGMNAE